MSVGIRAAGAAIGIIAGSTAVGGLGGAAFIKGFDLMFTNEDKNTGKAVAGLAMLPTSIAGMGAGVALIASRSSSGWVGNATMAAAGVGFLGGVLGAKLLGLDGE